MNSHQGPGAHNAGRRRSLRAVAAASVLATALALQLAGPTGRIGPSGAQLVASSTSIACSGSDSKVSYPPGPHGLFQVSSGGTKTAEEYVMNSSLICGAVFYANWSAIDLGPGHNPQYDFTALDSEIAPWEAAGKEVALIISGANEAGTVDSDTPSYVASKVTMVRCTGEPPVPVFWQSAYLSNWEAFIKATVDHFRSDPHVAYMRFGVTVDGEGYLPGLLGSSKSCLNLWDAQGYATDWSGYLHDLFTYEGSLGSDHRLVASMSYDDMENGGAAVAAAAGVGVGMEGMNKASADAVLTRQPCPNANWCAYYSALAGHTPLYVQMYSTTDPSGDLHTTPPSHQEITGPLTPLLQAGIALHTQIFEIWPADWLLALDPSYPGYATYHTAYVNALTAAAAVVNYVG